jgi:DNA-binding response OmpR family regulator
VETVTRGDKPDFIILDVLMPEMDGLETLRALMQVDRSLNVIMLSCSNEVGTVVEAIRLGAHDYLTKPFEKPELDAALLKCRQKMQLSAREQGPARILRPTDRRHVVPGFQPADAQNPPTHSANRARGCPGIHQR